MRTVKQAALYWDVSEATVKAWAAKGLIRAHKFGNRVWMITSNVKPVIPMGAPTKRRATAEVNK